MSAYLLCTVLFASQVEWLYCEGNKLLAVKLLLQVWQACLNSIRLEKLVVNTVTVTCHMESQHLSVDTVVDFFVLPVLWPNVNVKMKSMILCNSVAHGATSYHMNAVMFQTFIHYRAYLIFFFFPNILNKYSSEQNNRVFCIRLRNVNASCQYNITQKCWIPSTSQLFLRELFLAKLMMFNLKFEFHIKIVLA